MKFNFILSIAILLSLLSCRKKNVTDNNENAFTAKIEGTSYVAVQSYGRIVDGLDDAFQVAGMREEGEVVEVLFDDSKAQPGATIPCEGGCSYKSNTGLQDYAVGDEKGTVTISERTSKKIKGTFNYKAVDDFITPTKIVSVTGEFNVSIEKW